MHDAKLKAGDTSFPFYSCKLCLEPVKLKITANMSHDSEDKLHILTQPPQELTRSSKQTTL